MQAASHPSLGMMDLKWLHRYSDTKAGLIQPCLGSLNSPLQQWGTNLSPRSNRISAFQFPVAELISNSCRVTVLFPLKRKQMDSLKSKYKILPLTLLLVLPSLTELYPSLLTVLKEVLKAWVCVTPTVRKGSPKLLSPTAQFS